MLKYWEHYNNTIEEPLDIGSGERCIAFPCKRDEALCMSLKTDTGNKPHLQLSYFIGVDWIPDTSLSIYVEPKLNKEASQTNYLEMLFSALRHPEISKETEGLFDIKWDKPHIEIEQQQDHLTPLLVVQFLKVVQNIVRKGLKKSYYKVEQNLNSRVKGKILVSKTIKHNLLKNKSLQTFCCYDEFGLNTPENRLLKKALVFVQRYMPTLRIPQSQRYLDTVFAFVMPAFQSVSEDVSLHDIKNGIFNPFYKDYQEAIRLARLILKRFGYNITNTEKQSIKTPPFWIDMSKLFELYVLGLLKDRFGSEVEYHVTSNYQELDYLINSTDYKMVVDAKYKPIYQQDGKWDIENIRQISAYARLKKVYKELNKNEKELIDCLIIYPLPLEYNKKYKFDFKPTEIEDFAGFYKLGVKLPVITSNI